MGLFPQDTYRRVLRLAQASPVLAGAYLSRSTEVAAKVLLGQERIYPVLHYLQDGELDPLYRVDFAFLHSLFSRQGVEAPQEILVIPGLDAFTRLLWMAHRVTVESLALFPGLRQSWSAFLSRLLPFVEETAKANPRLNQVFFLTLHQWLGDPDSPFYSQNFKEAYLDLIHSTLLPKLPPFTPASTDEELAETLDRAVENLQRYLDAQQAMAQVEAPQAPTLQAVEEHRQAIDRVLRYNIAAIPALYGDQDYLYWETPLVGRAKERYGELVDYLKPYIQAMRHLFEAALHRETGYEIASSGRLHTRLLPPAMATGTVSPFVTLYPEAPVSLHMIFLLDESGSMERWVSLNLESPGHTSAMEALLGRPTPLGSNRITLAKLVAVLFLEALKTSSAWAEFYGYGESSVPQEFAYRGKVMWVRKLADLKQPYPLVSAASVVDNGDYAAISHAYSLLRSSPAQHRLVVYLADGEVSGARIEKAVQRLFQEGIHVIWLDLSGRSEPSHHSALRQARRFPVRSFAEAIQAAQGFLQEVISWS